jgi:L-lysine 6-transaminase
MEVIEKENLVENARVMGDYLLEGLKTLAEKYPEKLNNARGRGLMCAIDLATHEQRNALRDELWKDGMIILSCGDHSLRFRPHLNVTREEIQLALNKIENNINKI